MTIGAYMHCLAEGLSVPGDIALAGFNDLEMLQGLPLQLATPDAHRFEIGKKAAAIVLDCYDRPGGEARTENHDADHSQPGKRLTHSDLPGAQDGPGPGQIVGCVDVEKPLRRLRVVKDRLCRALGIGPEHHLTCALLQCRTQIVAQIDRPQTKGRMQPPVFSIFAPTCGRNRSITCVSNGCPAKVNRHLSPPPMRRADPPAKITPGMSPVIALPYLIAAAHRGWQRNRSARGWLRPTWTVAGRYLKIAPCPTRWKLMLWACCARCRFCACANGSWAFLRGRGSRFWPTIRSQ